MTITQVVIAAGTASATAFVTFAILSWTRRQLEIQQLKYSLSSAMMHIRALQERLKDKPSELAETEAENQRLYRLLREMRRSFRRRLGRPDGGIDINWPYIP